MSRASCAYCCWMDSSPVVAVRSTMTKAGLLCCCAIDAPIASGDAALKTAASSTNALARKTLMHLRMPLVSCALRVLSQYLMRQCGRGSGKVRPLLSVFAGHDWNRLRAGGDHL